MSKRILAALAGQPNCGKSTAFNMVTGARQHVANYPGVTVEKKVGFFETQGSRVELVDLPGTYSMTSYSLEERVARDFLLKDQPQVVVNVLDAANLKRHLYLTFQLLEMETNIILALNMMDVAERRGISVDLERLSEELGLPVVPTSAKTGKGKSELRAAMIAAAQETERAPSAFRVDYGALEPAIATLAGHFEEQRSRLGVPPRWLAIKLIEADQAAEELLRLHHPDPERILTMVETAREELTKAEPMPASQFIAYRRHKTAAAVARDCVTGAETRRRSFTDRIDAVVCNRYAGPLVLVGVLYLMYHLSIVQGYELTNYTWPLLAGMRSFIAGILPPPGMIEDSLLRGLVLWFTDSVNALLNYIPIFLILFAIIAMIEDSGYMPRIAFLLDRVFRRFGLHGQSTLPLILGGIYVGGCAIPGVMACRAIPDERSRLATILIVPLMNCLAKVPLYVLLVGAFFPQTRAVALFFIATVTIFIALPVAKTLSLTVLKNKESAPFIMELPPYHLPTITGVVRKALDRVWLFLKKIVTIVAAVAVILFVLLRFPGAPEDVHTRLAADVAQAEQEFMAKIAETRFAGELTQTGVLPLILFQERYKDARMGVTDKEKSEAIGERFEAENPLYYSIVASGGDKEAKVVGRELKKVDRARKRARMDLRTATLEASFLGHIGRFLEPVTQFAGFDWKVNISLLAAFAAKESTVATLGAIYEQGAQGEALEDRMRQQDAGLTPLHALALMLFMAMYPPCIATTIMVKLQSGDVRWMLFAIVYPMALGLTFASLVFSGGSVLGLSGLQAMGVFYSLCILATAVAALYNPAKEPTPQQIPKETTT